MGCGEEATGIIVEVDATPAVRPQLQEILIQVANGKDRSPLEEVFAMRGDEPSMEPLARMGLRPADSAVGALIGLMYLLARDGEMPRSSCGSTAMASVAALAHRDRLAVARRGVFANQLSLMELYAIGVVGAITVNLGCCLLSKKLKLRWFEYALMSITFVVLATVEITLAKTKPNDALFICWILGVGLAVRAYAQKRAGLRTVTVSHQVAAAVDEDARPDFRLNLNPGQSVLVAARGLNPVLRFALEEARLRQGTLTFFM